MNQKKIKPKIKTTKLDRNPLFVQFLNWARDKLTIEQILERVGKSFVDKENKKIVDNFKLDNEHLIRLDNFQNVFQDYILQFIKEKDISDEFLTWLNSAFNYIEESVTSYDNNEIRQLSIKNPDGRWFEGIICYNFILTYNFFGFEIIKVCPICKKFFAHKGKWAVYCQESCKEEGHVRRSAKNDNKRIKK